MVSKLYSLTEVVIIYLCVYNTFKKRIIQYCSTWKMHHVYSFLPRQQYCLETCGCIFTIWQLGSISNWASRCLSKSYHIPTCMESLNQQQSQKHMSCQRMNIHSVASTTQVELNANANNCYNFTLIFCLTEHQRSKYSMI